jgi:hypothetical protein
MRVLAVTTNASLAVALDSMMRDWEVVTVRDIDAAVEAGPGAVVALVDVGDTEGGLAFTERLYRSGVTIPFVIIGDRVVDDDRVTVLVRPFSLEELGTSVREAARRQVSRVEVAAEPALPDTTDEPSAPFAPEGGRGNGRGEISIAPPPPVPPPPVTIEDEVPVEVVEAPEAIVAEPEPEPEPLLAVPPEPEPEPDRFRESAADDRVAGPVPAAGTREPMYGTTEAHAAPTTGREPAPVRDERESEHADWSQAHPPRPSQPAPVEVPGRWRLRKKPTRTVAPEPIETPLVKRLKVAATQARQLETLLEELPFLADLRSMADGLAGEIEAVLNAAVASVFVRWEDGYHVVGFRGLSRVEAGMIVPETQSLFSDVLRTGEGILIQPLDLAQGLVAGIGGARTEALMAAPAVVHGECVAIVVAGGNEFVETDLDRLSDLAAEAAPGLAVAQLLERLRARSD